jgi:hypothetical protein
MVVHSCPSLLLPASHTNQVSVMHTQRTTNLYCKFTDKDFTLHTIYYSIFAYLNDSLVFVFFVMSSIRLSGNIGGVKGSSIGTKTSKLINIFESEKDESPAERKREKSAPISTIESNTQPSFSIDNEKILEDSLPLVDSLDDYMASIESTIHLTKKQRGEGISSKTEPLPLSFEENEVDFMESYLSSKEKQALDVSHFLGPDLDMNSDEEVYAAAKLADAKFEYKNFKVLEIEFDCLVIGMTRMIIQFS